MGPTIKNLYDHDMRIVNYCITFVYLSSVLYRWANCSVGEEILKDLLPGPFTLIFERSSDLNPDLNPGVHSVGIRIPDSAVCIKLVSQLGAPIALTSANISGKSSTISIDVSAWIRVTI